jgi:hypothetical protein
MGSSAKGGKSCYSITMAKHGKTIGRDAKTGRFVVGRAGFEKISAVEGITPTKGMKVRASEARRQGMTAEEYRSSIVRNYRKS